MDKHFWQSFDVQKTTLVAPTKRLAKSLQNAYNAFKIDHKCKSWEGADIFPYTIWIKTLWQTLDSPKILLNDSQTDLIWQKIVLEHFKDAPLTDTSYFTKKAQEAYGLAANWQCENELINYAFNDTTRTYLALAAKFKKYLKDHSFLDKTALTDFIIENISQDNFKNNFGEKSQNIIFCSFDTLPPQTERLINLLKEKNISKITYFDFNNQQNTKSYQIAFASTKQEILTMARFAKKHQDLNPQSNIGCIVPDLRQKRDLVFNIFMEIFEDKKKFNISVGKSLKHYPIIDAALFFLNLSINRFNFTAITLQKLLHSPFWFLGESEILARVELENRLLKTGQTKFTLNDLIEHAKRLVNKNSLFINALEKYSELVTALPKDKQPYDFWALFFTKVLQVLGWPGERVLNSEEFQLQNRCQKLFLEFTTLGLITNKVTLKEALDGLNKLANTIFQPEQVLLKHVIPIQILGPLEAAGLNFDKLWVMGQNNEATPSPPKPNPLLPLPLQKKLNMPQASSTERLNFAQNLIQRFTRSANEIIFSYAKNEEDREVKISPLLIHLAKIDCEDLELETYITKATKIHYHYQKETYEDSIAPKISSNENIKGGVKILEKQAICPFSAFAHWRLHLEITENTEIGISKIMRGNLLHFALEKIWQKIQNKKTLDSLPEEELNTIIKQSLEQAFKHHTISFGTISHKLLSIEKKCLARLITKWLEEEKKRPNFELVFCEKEINLTIATLPIKLRVDRIDRLENGELLIIDYKTGKTIPSINDLISKRPSAPQLPLYCIAITSPRDNKNRNDEIKSIAFAKINSEQILFSGLSADDTKIKGIMPLNNGNPQNGEIKDWQTLIKTWQENLNLIAQEFIDGIAKVAPKDAPKSCEYCKLYTLCRIKF